MKKYVVRGKVLVTVTIVVPAASPEEAQREALRKKVSIASGGSAYPGEWQVSNWPTEPEVTEVIQGS